MLTVRQRAEVKISSAKGKLWALSVALPPSLNETEYFEPAITTGSYGISGFTNTNALALDATSLIFGKPTISSLPLRTIRIDQKIRKFLDANALWPALDAAEWLRSELESKAALDMSLRVEADTEALDREELVLVYRIHNMDYRQILEIWNEASRRLQKLLPAPMAERVYVRLTKG